MSTDEKQTSENGYTVPASTGVLQPTSFDLFEQSLVVIKEKRDLLMAIPGVLNVRPKFHLPGESVQGASMIVTTHPNGEVGELPKSIDGIFIETQPATALELIEGFLPLTAWEGIQIESAPVIHYTPPTDVKLLEREVHNITCHVGPDSGWNTLKPFLEGTTKSLTVAMYDFYATHIVETITRLGEQTPATLAMILQVTTNSDDYVEGLLKDSWGDRLDFVPASVDGPNQIFDSAYHTKVAVRDSESFWLSSGNWTPTSQPVIGVGTEQTLYTKGNREWHIIIEDKPLAEMYEKFIQHDMRQARDAGQPETAPVLPDLLVPESEFIPEATVLQDHPFVAKKFATSGSPIRVKPLMTPDNYVQEILKLIQQAEHSLYLQFSYINEPRETLEKIVMAIAEKMQDGVDIDVRVLVGKKYQQQQYTQLLLGRYNWNPEKFRLQTSRIHNKGILIDGKIAVVGSHNWSTPGTHYNRDSSLVLFSKDITDYYTEVFLFDWDNLSVSVGSGPEVAPVLAPESGPTPLGMVRVPWRAWFDD